MKFLSGKDLVGFIKNRQAKQVRALKQAYGIYPKLAIVEEANDDLVGSKFAQLKLKYGDEIGIQTEVLKSDLSRMKDLIHDLNQDPSVHGIIVQLPLSNRDQTDIIVDAIRPDKDIDGLGKKAKFDSASATAIMWLLSAYNIDLKGKEIALVGQGRLIGRPLLKMMQQSGLEPKAYDEHTNNIGDKLKIADIIITATGTPGLVTSKMIKPGAVVIDAGTASVNGKIVGDVDESVYQTKDDIKITPKIGGVGPVTIAVLFDNLIRASRDKVEEI